MSSKNISVVLLFALTIGCVGMLLAWKHNPQCEIHCDEILDWWYFIQIGATWFFMAVFFGLTLQCIIQTLIRHMKKHCHDRETKP